MVQVCDSPACFEDQAGDLGHLIEIDFVDRIRGPMIINVCSGEVKDDRNPVLGVVPMVGTVIDSFRVGGIVVIIIQIHFLKLLVGFRADLVQFLADTV